MNDRADFMQVNKNTKAHNKSNLNNFEQIKRTLKENFIEFINWKQENRTEMRKAGSDSI